MEAAGRMLVGSVQSAEHAKIMLDNYVAISSRGQLLTQKLPNVRDAYYLKQAQQCRGS